MSAIALAWEQFRLERKLFWRNPSAAFFNFILPLLLLLLVASVFAGEQDELRVLIPGIAGMSVMATTFNALVFNVTFLREEGILKRVRGTPIPTASYLAGLIGSAVANAFVTVAIVIVVGNLVYDVAWPQEPLILVAFTALGVVCFASLGIAFSHAIPNVDSVPAYQNAVFLPLIFISGVFYSADDLPPALEAIAEALPLKHVIDGLSAGIVGAQVNEAAAAAVAGAWALLGVFLAVRFFRWG
jgi:ABC-2 type transport system permease protein